MMTINQNKTVVAFMVEFEEEKVVVDNSDNENYGETGDTGDTEDIIEGEG